MFSSDSAPPTALAHGSFRTLAAPMDALDSAIRTSLEAFTAAVFAQRWRGMEHEATSWFALGFLQKHCRAGAALYDPAQIVVDGSVPSPTGPGTKGHTRNLVIWPAPGGTAFDEQWEATREPLVIMEWKVYREASRAAAVSQFDVRWLCEFSATRPAFVGYSVALDLSGDQFQLNAARCTGGEAELDWLDL